MREVESRSQEEPGARKGPDSNFLYRPYHPDSMPISLCCHPALQHASSGKASQILSTCIQFTDPSQTCDYLTSCEYHPEEP